MKELMLEFSKVTEAAALATYNKIGKGKKEEADSMAVDAMRHVLNQIKIDGEVVIGEGEIDEAPMLYIGEKVGCGTITCDIAVDPIDGTRMVALGQDNAVAVIVFAKKGSLLKAPDMYMKKLMVNKNGVGSIDINKSLEENVISLAKKLNKKISELTIMTLQKPRHENDIELLQNLGVKVIAIPDGDVEGSILTAMPNENIDMFYGIGGAPEGVISAAVIKSMDGDMQAKLMTRSDAKGKTDENDISSKLEKDRCENLGISINEKLILSELVSSDNVVVSMTGITDGKLLKGVRINKNIATTHTLLIRGKTKTIRKIESTHMLDIKDEYIQELIKK